MEATVAIRDAVADVGVAGEAVAAGTSGGDGAEAEEGEDGVSEPHLDLGGSVAGLVVA